nr:unnamed protein product [Callosobruchus chinensis]
MEDADYILVKRVSVSNITKLRRAIRLIGDPVLTCHLQPHSHRRRRAVGDLSLSYRYSNGVYSSELPL